MKYKIHEVAALFPLMVKGSRPYNDLEEHIRLFGQLEPIVVDGDILLDGRNRLAVCEGLGIPPKVVEWATLGIKNEQHEWIFGKNVARRNLSEQERLAIYVAYSAWTEMDDARQRKAQTGFKPGVCSNPFGRAGKQVDLISGPPVTPPKRDINAKNANSTAGRIAAATGVSRYKAEKVLTLAKQAREGDEQAQADLEAVQRGEKKLREVARKPKKEKPIPTLQKRVERAWLKFWKQFTTEERGQVNKWISEQL